MTVLVDQERGLPIRTEKAWGQRPIHSGPSPLAEWTCRATEWILPAQWLFGVSPILSIGLVDGDDDAAERQDLIDPSDDWQRRANIRQAAREAYVQLQATESLQRALHGRPRVQQGDFQQGQYVVHLPDIQSCRQEETKCE